MSRKVVHAGMNYPSALVNVVLFLAHILDAGLVYHNLLYWFALMPKCVLSYELKKVQLLHSKIFHLKFIPRI